MNLNIVTDSQQLKAELSNKAKAAKNKVVKLEALKKAGASATTSMINILRDAVDEGGVILSSPESRAHFSEPALKLPKVAKDYLSKEDFSHTTKSGKDVYESFSVKAQRFSMIALTHCLNAVLSGDPVPYGSAVINLGKAIEQEARFAAYKQFNPRGFQSIEDNILKTPLFGIESAVQFANQVMDSKGFEYSWGVKDDRDYAKVGSYVMNAMFAIKEPLFQLDLVKEEHTVGHTNFIVGTEAFHSKVDVETAALVSQANSLKPMLTAPAMWSNNAAGGYLSNGVAVTHDLVRKVGKEAVIGDTPINFLNNLQSTGLRVNRWVYDVVTQLLPILQADGIGLGSLKVAPVKGVTVIPGTDRVATTKDVIKGQRNAGKAAMTIQAAAEFVDQDCFYLPWSFDYRGRVYPLSSVLNVQDTDFGKSLVRFSDEAPVNSNAAWWLSIQLANTFGHKIDKLSLADRVAWAAAQHDYVSAVVADPVSFAHYWAHNPDADDTPSDPWVFLATCEEFYATVITGERDTTGLMVATDATCSGLQVLAGVTRDASTAAHVNVVPNPTPADAYQAVIDEAVKALAPETAAKVTRKVAKKVVMTIPYNSKGFTHRDQVAEALTEANVEYTWDEVKAIADALAGGVQTLMPTVLNVMDWVSDVMATGTKQGNLQTVSWTSPSGFQVVQTKQAIKSFKVRSLGSSYTLMVDIPLDKVDAKAHKTSTAPNLIHSLDASLLHLTFEGFDKPFSVIHDSILTRATDMDEAVSSLKATYAQVFEGEVLADFLKDVLGVTTPCPFVVTGESALNPNVVLGSDYFFS